MTTVGTLFRKLFGLDYRHPNAEKTYPIRARILPWSELGRACMALHIADASNVKKGRKGWDAAYGRTG